MRTTQTVVVVLAVVAISEAPAVAQRECRLKQETTVGRRQICEYACRGADDVTVVMSRRCPSTLADPDPRGPYIFSSPGAAAAKAIEELRREQLEEEKLRLEVERLRREVGTEPSATNASVSLALPARIYIEGGSKALRNDVIALIRASSDMVTVSAFRAWHGNNRGAEANFILQKNGTAKVKCGDHATILPGPTPQELMRQLRAFLRVPLAIRRRGAPIPETIR